MIDDIKVGDVIKLFDKYEDAASLALVIEVNRCESLGDGGWITFDYKVMNESGELLNISSSCVEEVLYTINQSPSTWLHSSCSSN